MISYASMTAHEKEWFKKALADFALSRRRGWLERKEPRNAKRQRRLNHQEERMVRLATSFED